MATAECVKVVARVTVDVYIDAENLYAAEAVVSALVRQGRTAHRITASDWVPAFMVSSDCPCGGMVATTGHAHPDCPLRENR